MNEIHDKAIRLVEGGIVEIDGHCFSMVRNPDIIDPCNVCELDSICHKGNTICDVCMECEIIIRERCFLVLIENKQ